MKNKFALLLLSTIVLIGCSHSNSSHQTDLSKEFGVFLGMDSESKDINKLLNYKNVAHEIEEFSSSDIATLKSHNVNIFAYISVGSLEDYRDYYDEFKDYTFMDYDNWEHERWIDVSQVSWQKHLSDTASRFKSLGATGLFMDNFDVYYIALEEYDCSDSFKEDIYNGCKTILSNFDHLELSLMINSGTTFLERLSSEKCGCINFIDWYAQESVFSKIVDHDNDVFGVQDEEEHDYYLEMIDLMKHYSRVLMIEYTKDDELIKTIKEYADKNGINYFISSTVNLE